MKCLSPIVVLLLVAHPILSAGEFQPDSNTVPLWHFNEGMGDTVYDASDNANFGIVYGAQWGLGKFGNALVFDGIDDYIQVPASLSLNITAPITIEAGIHRSVVDVHHFILSKGGWQESYELQVLWNVVVEDNKLRFIMYPETISDSQTKIGAGKWTHHGQISIPAETLVILKVWS